MKRYYAILSLFLISIPSFSADKCELLDSLDHVLSLKDNYTAQRVARINILERQINECTNQEMCFNLIV